jgi:hypothetical protein
MQVRSLKEATEKLNESMRRKGFYDVDSVEALLEFAQHLEKRVKRSEGGADQSSVYGHSLESRLQGANDRLDQKAVSEVRSGEHDGLHPWWASADFGEYAR